MYLITNQPSFLSVSVLSLLICVTVIMIYNKILLLTTSIGFSYFNLHNILENKILRLNICEKLRSASLDQTLPHSLDITTQRLFGNLVSDIRLPLSLLRIWRGWSEVAHWSEAAWLRPQKLEGGWLALGEVRRNKSGEKTSLSALHRHVRHHLCRELANIPRLRVALLIDHRLQETAASTFRFRIIIKSQQLVARGVQIVAVEVQCHETAVRLLQKKLEAGRGLLWSEVEFVFTCLFAKLFKLRDNEGSFWSSSKAATCPVPTHLLDTVRLNIVPSM